MPDFPLLQFGNKLVKQLRDENSKIYDFLNWGSSIDGSIIADCVCYPLDYCDGRDNQYFLSNIRTYCDDFACEYKQGDWDWDFDFNYCAFSDFVAKAEQKMANNREKMQEFYEIKRQIVLSCGKPIAVHQSDYIKDYVCFVGDGDGKGECDILKTHDYFVLFDCDGHSFHLPYDDVMDKWGDDFLNTLPKGEVGLISATLPDDTPYAHLSLDDVITRLADSKQS